jgi:hypothetical protein
MRKIAGVLAACALVSLLVAGLASGSKEKRAIESADGVAITDYDGHAHRTSPKRVGENLNLWCRSSSNERQTVSVGVYFQARQLVTRTLKCPSGSTPRHHRIVRLRHTGVYGMVLSGGWFDAFIIRTHVRRGNA